MVIVDIVGFLLWILYLFFELIFIECFCCDSVLDNILELVIEY